MQENSERQFRREIKGGQSEEKVDEKLGEKVGEKSGEKVGEILGEIHKLNLCRFVVFFLILCFLGAVYFFSSKFFLDCMFCIYFKDLKKKIQGCNTNLFIPIKHSLPPIFGPEKNIHL